LKVDDELEFGRLQIPITIRAVPNGIMPAAMGERISRLNTKVRSTRRE
jgi:hypothetical protein